MNRRDFVVTGLAACSMGCSWTLRDASGAVVKGCRTARAGADLRGRILKDPPPRWEAKWGRCKSPFPGTARTICPFRFNTLALAQPALGVWPAMYFYDDEDSQCPRVTARCNRSERCRIAWYQPPRSAWDREDAQQLSLNQ
jgi:hypothetical protein